MSGVLGGVGAAQSALTAAWQPVGPAQVASQRYGLVTGRVTSIAVDPTDSTGNTVYIGTTGGGVWKSTNAAGAAGTVTFTPLTDSLPVFSGNAGSPVMPALSIGAVSVGNGVVLAGTGDPNDSIDSYYGVGILRSADGGVTWTVATDSDDGVDGRHAFEGLAFSAFAWSTQTTGLVVAAVSQAAEGVLVNALNAMYSAMGLYYSTDGGATWKIGTIKDGTAVVQQPSNSVPGNAVTAVVWNPVRQRFYAAVRFHGYYESVDGMTWTRLTNQPGTGMSIVACPTNPGLAGNPSCPLYRGALAVDAVSGDTYALTIDIHNNDQGLWRDVCATNGSVCTNAMAFGSRIDSTMLEAGGGSTAIAQADYNLSLAAVSSGSDTFLFVGTADLYRCSVASGCMLRNTTNAVNGCAAPAKVAPAQHAVAGVSGAGTAGAALVLIGNDGGVWRSTDGVNQQQTPCSADDAKHFDNLNGGLGSLAEVVSFAQDPADRGTLLVGLGANGTAATGNAAGGAAWTQLSAGEGGTVAIDQTNPLNWYVETAAGTSIAYCGKGSACGQTDFGGVATLGYPKFNQDSSAIHVPFLLDPLAASNILVGTCRVWRGPAQSGATWPGTYEISAMLGVPQGTVCGNAGPVVHTLSAGGPASGATAPQNAGSTVLYAGMAGRLDGGGSYGGHLFAIPNAALATASTVWNDLSNSPVTNASAFNPGQFDLSSVVADPHDPTGKTVYATVAGFSGNGINAAHVYRSADFGAHWTNISSNLQNVPTNALVVDPNDANTLYVATDAGVYVTNQVTNCSSVNCWTRFGPGLPNAPVVAMQAATKMSTGDGRTGELRVGTYGRGIWEIPLLTASGQAVPAISLSATTLTFSVQQVGTLSASQTVTVTNSGSAALTVSRVAASGDFSTTDTCTGASVAVGASCAIQVKFLPSATGTRTGMVTIYANVSGGQATVALTGTSTSGAAVVLSPTSVAFGATDVGSTSSAQNITISNTGGVTVSLQAPVITGNFAISANTCSGSLGPGVGCTVSIVFRPTSSGTRSGTFSVTDDAGTQSAVLSGTGVLPATDSITPLILSFGQQALNTASATQQVTLTNAGDTPLQLIAAQITTGDFTVVNACGNSLNGHSTCSLMVSFVPKSVGTASGVMTISDQYRSQTVSLTGTGVAPAGVSLSPIGGVSFGGMGLGLSANAQTVTVSNNSGVTLAIQNIAASGDFAIVAGANTCGGALPTGSACTVQVVFAPTVPGQRSGSVTVVDSAAGSPHTLALSGTGIDFGLTANGPVAQTVTAGGSATYALLLSGAAGLPGTAAMACAGAPAYTTCTVTPSGPAIAGSTLVTVTIATSSADLRMPAVPGTGSGNPVWFAVLLPAGLLFVPRTRMRAMGAVLMFCAVLGLGGCAAPRLIPATTAPTGSGNGGATPKGTYAITVSGASAGLTRSVGLTLIVQ